MDSVPGSLSDRSVAKPVAADTSLSLPLPHSSYAPQYAAAYQSAGPHANPSHFAKHPVNPISTSAPSLAQGGQLPQPQAQATPARLPAVGPPPTQHPGMMYGNAVSAGNASAQQQGVSMSRAPGSTSPMNRQHVMPQSFAPLHPHNQSANPPSLSHRPAKRPPPRSQAFSQQPLSLPHADQFQNHPFSIPHNQRPRTQDGHDGAKQRRLCYPQHSPMSSDQPHFTPGRSGSVHSEPFPNSKSLPYPIPAYPPSPSRVEPASRPFATSLSAPLPGISSHTSSLPAGAMPTISPLNSSNNFFLYDIGKLHQSRCTVIAGKVYNDKGHSICGVLNQHDKPCKRIGKCPFHGTATSVSASNSCNGIVDESGTAVRSPGVADDVSSPPISGGTVPSDLSGLRGSSLSALNSRPTVPPKKLQYKHGWTKEEHFLFLHGLEMHSKGSWKQIAAVVRSRTPTQVQSHAQKYFLRQKQYNKNKRSIHDLTMDAPEMRDLQKRLRNGEFKSGKTNTGVNGNLHNPTRGVDGLGRSRDSNVLSLQQPMSHPPVSFAQNDALPGAVTDSNMSRFGNVGNTIVPRFGPGQAVSATTLGSSMSSGVRVPQGNCTYPQRPSFQNGSNILQQQDILGHASNATVTSTAKGMIDGASDRQSVDMAPRARDVTLSGGRLTFGQDACNNTGQHAPGAPLESPRLLQLQKSEAMISPAAMDKNAEGYAANMTTQQPYSASGFPNLYAQANGHAVFSQSQQRVAAEGQQFTWPCETEMKSRRTKGFLQGGRESIQLNGSFGAMGPLSMSEGFANVTVSGLGNQDQMESTFDGAGSHQSPAFAAGIFGNGEAIDVHEATHGYGVHGSTQSGGHPGTSAQARDVSAVMNGFGGPGGLGLGGLPLRGQGSLSNAPFARN